MKPDTRLLIQQENDVDSISDGGPETIWIEVAFIDYVIAYHSLTEEVGINFTALMVKDIELNQVILLDPAISVIKFK